MLPAANPEMVLRQMGTYIICKFTDNSPPAATGNLQNLAVWDYWDKSIFGIKLHEYHFHSLKYFICNNQTLSLAFVPFY